jgi:hypothetical protein
MRQKPRFGSPCRLVGGITGHYEHEGRLQLAQTDACRQLGRDRLVHLGAEALYRADHFSLGSVPDHRPKLRSGAELSSF